MDGLCSVGCLFISSMSPSIRCLETCKQICTGRYAPLHSIYILCRMPRLNTKLLQLWPFLFSSFCGAFYIFAGSRFVQAGTNSFIFLRINLTLSFNPLGISQCVCKGITQLASSLCQRNTLTPGISISFLFHDPNNTPNTVTVKEERSWPQAHQLCQHGQDRS
jgi:hypothetical protein